MKPVRIVEGTMAPLGRADVDTDQIMPKQFLKRIERTGFGEYVFSDWRADPSFVLNQPQYAGATILVAGPNFGCGSSREHAPWGLQQWGFEAIVAPSFADIFRSNCSKIGLLTVELPVALCTRLLELAAQSPKTRCHVDVAQQRLTAGPITATFSIGDHTRHMLLEGLDDIALTLRDEALVATFEQGRPRYFPRTTAGG